jgi:hypothetical protein
LNLEFKPDREQSSHVSDYRCMRKNLDIPDTLQKCGRKNTLHRHYTSLDPIRGFTHETKTLEINCTQGRKSLYHKALSPTN